MDDLIAFVRAQMDEDQEGLEYWLGNLAATSQAAEWVRHWLAEVVVKRRILELHEPQPTGYVDGRYVHGETGQLQCAYCAEQCHSRSGLSCDMPDAPWPCATVRLLIQPYAGREGWRDEWTV